MFARLLTLTRYIEQAATFAALPRRTVIRLNAEEWSELLADPQFAKIHDGKTYTVMNNVLIRLETPVAPETAHKRWGDDLSAGGTIAPQAKAAESATVSVIQRQALFGDPSGDETQSEFERAVERAL